MLPECDPPSPASWCAYSRDTSASNPDDPGPSADVAAIAQAVARQATLSLELPEPTIKLGPDPSVNKWDMAVVGFPLWVWTEDPDSVSATVTENGITINIQATRDNVTFDFGDGATLTCTTMSPLPSSYEAGDPSPTCGHTYEAPSLPKGDYTITATARWTFAWSALGYSGTLPGEVTATRSVPVGELQAVLIPTND